MTTVDHLVKLTKKDFTSDQDVRWCPGCGDYAILAAVQKTLPELGVAKENAVFISGIGCSSRFPYYMDTYGFHSIHGRAPALATGLKVSRPDLSVWVITGDGDGLSIGGNHLIHAIRRNVDLTILLFNNKIYGLTKGQYSPTSPVGTKAPSTPYGSVDSPLNPVALALGANSTFVARCVDIDAKAMVGLLKRAHAHKGTALIEIMQNCPVFNDDVWAPVADRKVKSTRQLQLVHGSPLRFGADGERGICLTAEGYPEVVEIGDGPGQVPEARLVIHDETAPTSYAMMLAHMNYPDFPIPMGVLRCTEKTAYDAAAIHQVKEVSQTLGKPDMAALLRSGMTWTVE